MKLVYTSGAINSNPGRMVEIGDACQVGHGTLTIENITEPHKPSSTGRVGGSIVTPQGKVYYAEYFPAVIGAVWIDREDR